MWFKRLERWSSIFGYPLILLAALLSVWRLLSTDLNPGLSTGLVVLIWALLIGALERWAPFSKAWRVGPSILAIDLMHALVSGAVIAPLVRISAQALVVVLGAQLALQGPWPGSWPLALQVALALVISDFGAYWAHRWMHTSSIGWRIHAVHHSPTRLDFLAGSRSHPFNAMLTLCAETLPLLLLGISTEALALLTVFKGVNGLLQHANINYKPGWLAYVLATSENHRWHHSVVLKESDTNFGNTTMLWDHCFGTFFLPKDRRPQEKVGVVGAIIPERYGAHLLTPFVYHRFQEQADEPPLS